MTTPSYTAILDALRDAAVVGDPHAELLTKRLTGWLDQLGFTLVGHSETGEAITKPASECTPVQQLKAARFAEYELRDGIVLARNSASTGRGSSANREKRIDEHQGELGLLMGLVPQRMPAPELEATLTQMISAEFATNPHTTVAKMVAVVLKRLSTEHPFQYDSRVARNVVISTVSCLLA